MRRLTFALVLMLVAVPVAVADDDDEEFDASRSYDRPISVVWDEAVKAVRDANFVVLDSKRSEYWFTMRTKSKLSAKRGMPMKVELEGDLNETTVTISLLDEDDDEEDLEKPGTKYLEALDKRLD